VKKSAQVKPDIAGLINKMQEQLAVLEKKIDTLISRPSASHAQANRPPETKQSAPPRERIMHKTICADCNSACEVPFKPTGDRPVYCKECFAKRRAGVAPQPKPELIKPVKEQPGKVRKPAEKKKKPSSRKKKR